MGGTTLLKRSAESLQIHLHSTTWTASAQCSLPCCSAPADKKSRMNVCACFSLGSVVVPSELHDEVGGHDKFVSDHMHSSVGQLRATAGPHRMWALKLAPTVLRLLVANIS